MTALRQSAMLELEKIPEDKLSFILQIMQGVNGLYSDTKTEKKEAFLKLEQFSDGRLTEPSDGIRYEWRKMIDEVKRLGRPLTEKEAEVFKIK